MKPTKELYNPKIRNACKSFYRALVPLLFDIERNGFENIPEDKNFILAMNHVYWFDPVLTLITVDQVCFGLAMGEVFDRISNPPKNPFKRISNYFYYFHTKNLGTYPVKRKKVGDTPIKGAEGHHDYNNYLPPDPEFRAHLLADIRETLNLEDLVIEDIDAFIFTRYLFQAGESILWCPQGHTYRDSSLKKLKTGLARACLEIAENFIPPEIIPCSIEYGKLWLRTKVKINIGEPFTLEDYLEPFQKSETPERDSLILNSATIEVMQHIQDARDSF